MTTQTAPEIHGHVEPAFAPVREVFAENWPLFDEIGAGFSVQIGGETVIDLHAGWADRKKTRAWTEKTIVPVYSTGKAVAALVIARLVDQGLLDYEAKVADYWPEFAAGGKSGVTVAQALSHQAGLSGLKAEMDAADWFDAALIEQRLAAQRPLWDLAEGGSGYSPITFGFIADALARRTDGRSIGALLREEVCGPRGIDFHVGLAASEHERVAEHAMPKQMPQLGEINDVKKIAFLKAWSSPGRRGAAQWREAEFPAANGHASAPALARLMQVYAMKGRLDGKRFISETSWKALTQKRVSGPDRVLPFHLSWAAGVMINDPAQADGERLYGPEASSFGHSGWGGSCAFADPERGLTGAYVMNRQQHFLAGDPRARRLIQAVYGCL